MSAAIRRFIPLIPASLVRNVYPPCLSTALSFSSLSSPSDPPESHTSPSRTRTRTPLESQFETWIQNLKPGFTHSDVVAALRAQSDPDLALDIFRWTAQQRGYKHNHEAYHTMIIHAITGKRNKFAETLIEEVVAGACEISVPLYNSIIRFCCGRKFLFNRAFDVYNKMLRSDNAKPDLETYTLLLSSLLKRFSKMNVCYVYLHAVRSLTKQMKSGGVIPDTYVFNLIIKAYAKCLEVDEAIRVFREMPLYGSEPNAYTYTYLIKGLCERGGRLEQGFGFFKEMRSRGMVPNGSCHMVLICSLAMEKRLNEAVEVVYDMLANSMSPDMLTYNTVLGELCREGRGDEALELLGEWKKKDPVMGEKNYSSLMDELYFLNKG